MSAFVADLAFSGDFIIVSFLLYILRVQCL